MKQYVKILITAVFILSFVMSFFMVQMIIQIQSYGKLINYVGIVRGTTQRLVKLEISQQSNDQLITSLDNIIEELNTGEGDIGLAQLDSITYNSKLKELTILWEDIKEEINQVREGKEQQQLIYISEEYFDIADDTVFMAEEYSNMKIRQLTYLSIILTTSILMMLIIVIILYIRKSLRLETANKNLRDKIYTDELTGAPNLEKFKLEGQKILDNLGEKKLAILYIDFENFKYINDIFGYEYGDSILKEYADIIKSTLFENEIFCRVTADNFIILKNYYAKEELLKKQQCADSEIFHYAITSQEQYFITLCCGICCAEDLNERDIDTLIERANFARKMVKTDIKRQYGFYDESIRNKMYEEKSIENRMHQALENEEFIIYLQPKVRLSDNKIVQAEALVRWQTTDKGIIMPGIFIPIFEKNLFIVKLDQYVLEATCKWIRNTVDKGENVIPISVNVSRMQLYNPEFVSVYGAIKKKYEIPDGMIEIEFTESVVFENLEILKGIINGLKSHGFTCSLDDFGKGYSSLNVLKNLSVDVLKMDGLFFDETEDQMEINKARTVVQGIVAMVKSLNIKVVAEGVEKEEQVDFLRRIGCDLIQGYVFYRPMPIESLEKLIEE